MATKNNVRLEINASAQDVLARIRSSTEREILPFVSVSSYPQQSKNEFVSHISKTHIRIWKVPSSTKARQNLCAAYLSGEVLQSANVCVLNGHFAIHPSSRLKPVLPLACIAVPVWLFGERTGHFYAIAVAVTIICLLALIIGIDCVRRLRPQEERDIVLFLSKLFPEADNTSKDNCQ
jgi:hypothetical protein